MGLDAERELFLGVAFMIIATYLERRGTLVGLCVYKQKK
jgi:hypothetical protein